MTVEEPKESGFETWRDAHRCYCGVVDAPIRLVRLHVTQVPDNLECSQDGHVWGVLCTESRVRSALPQNRTIFVRMFRAYPHQRELKRDSAVGYGLDEYVFIKAETYDAIKAIS